MNRRAGRLGVGIIGAGRVGPVLGAALAGAGHALVGIAAVSDESRERADAMLPGVPILEVPRLIEVSELVIIAVPDAELPGLIAGLTATRVWQRGQLVLHTSPRFGIDVLEPALEAGVIPLAVHPAMSFTGTSIDLARLRESWCAVTAPVPVQPIGQALVVEMGAEPVLIDERDRWAYAEAIDTATGFSSEIVRQAAGILRSVGVERPGAVLGPLVRSAIDNALAAAGEHDPDPVDPTAFEPDLQLDLPAFPGPAGHSGTRDDPDGGTPEHDLADPEDER
ncbi:Rossmann-like and DUF2520 domain-containing protein [Ruicaihuangia caeni]|uniref:DUF2520 domain-containing protein n=1 Tax=Ruicaihuangia caeni TaxID=3042517 RepID=A0AAW6T4U0_9MICO|nr:DUF2520 domain-containing protein [Klugiella sp. YN-L-19]MDI2098459.1 DUF2520 domain-containing protein [Klugiella sp. YN-L-19]